MRTCLLLSTLLLLPACVTEDDLGPEAEPPVSSDIEIPGEGETGVARVRLPDGTIEELPFTVIRGRARVEGDIDLGPVDELLLARGGAANLGDRWPNGNVRFTFHPDFTGSARTKVRDVLAELEARTPLNFTEIAHSTASGDYITYQWMDGDDEAAGTSEVGMTGGEQTIYLRNDGIQPAWSTTRHETLHAMGMWHEQSRNDRDSFVEVHYECIDFWHEHNFWIHGDSADLGPYDFDSIMHYSAGAFCNEDDRGACECNSIERLFGSGALGGGNYSREDINTLYRMYAKDGGTNEASDHFAAALAAGDFDNDGYTDVAVGAPNENGIGVVQVYRGTSVGLVQWQTIWETSFSTGETGEVGESFGTAVAAGDFDGDGRDDLAIGAPFEEGAGGVNAAGAVYVFRGTTSGLIGHRKLSQSLTGIETDEAAERFGSALAFGHLTGKDEEVLAVGTPGEKNPGLFGGTVTSGAVYLFQEVGGVLYHPTKLRGGTLGGNGDEFGAALAIGPIDQDGKDDLVVGAPGAGDALGAVSVFEGRLPTETPFGWSAMATLVDTIVGTSAGDELGEAVSIGDYSSVFGQEVAIGVPGRSSDRGEVQVWRMKYTTLTGTDALQLQTTLTQGSGAESADRFGAALASGEVLGTTGDDELVVGAPGEDSGAGQVTIFRNNGTAFGAATHHLQPAGYSPSEAGDHFGAVLAVGNIDGSGDGGHSEAFDNEAAKREDIIIGAPDEDPEVGITLPEDPSNAGALFCLRGETGVSPSYFSYRHQEHDGGL